MCYDEIVMKKKCIKKFSSHAVKEYSISFYHLTDVSPIWHPQFRNKNQSRSPVTVHFKLVQMSDFYDDYLSMDEAAPWKGESGGWSEAHRA